MSLKIKSKKYITTILDSIIYNIFNIGQASPKYKEINGKSYLVKEFKKKDIIIELRAEIPRYLLKRCYENLSESEKNEIYSKLYSDLTFSSSEILVYLILLSNVLEDNNSISLCEIHKKFRDMSIKRPIEKETRDTYINAIRSLGRKKLYIRTSKNFRRNKSSFNNLNLITNLVNVVKKQKLQGGDIKYIYTIGRLGEILKNSRHFSNEILPVEIYHIGLSQISKFLIATYLGLLIFTNRRKKLKYFVIKLTSIMKIIAFFDKHNSNTNKSYLDKMEDTLSNKTTILRRFVNYVISVLVLLKAHNKISSYEIIPRGTNEKNTSVKSFEEIKFKIYMVEY